MAAGGMGNAALWGRLSAFEFDDIGATAPYSTKLAVAEQWTDAFTAQVIEEYRKFLYLIQVTDAPLVPPLAVLRAWQMHLTFSRNYWDRLCADVLGRPLHYDPIQNNDDLLGYRIRYEDARRLYEREFGTPPPGEIWRAKPDEAALDKPPLPGGPYFALAGLGVAVLFAWAGFGALPWIVPFLAFFALVAVLIAVSAMAGPKHRRKKDKDDDWFAFEYRNADGGDGGDGDGDGGGCGD